MAIEDDNLPFSFSQKKRLRTRNIYSKHFKKSSKKEYRKTRARTRTDTKKKTKMVKYENVI